MTKKNLALLILYSSVIFLSAFLLFSVQPIFAKVLLPMLGGAPAIWNTCMVFFQVILLLGYIYAHVLSNKLSTRAQKFLHTALILLALFSLPLGLSENWTPPTESNPIPWLLSALAVGVGLPFFLVSTTAPLLQRWFSFTDHEHAKDPYFLYAASNFGSFMALLSYPFLIEPNIPTSEQLLIWGFGLMALSVLFVFLLPGLPEKPEASEVSSKASSSQRANWILLAFVPSSLLLGVTLHITTDVSAVPLLWILPLALYLLRFVFVFSKFKSLRLEFLKPIFPPLVAFAAVTQLVPSGLPIWAYVLAHFLCFFLLAVYCHGKLAENRPDVSQLTEFYLCMSIGGALGGIFNAIVAPLVFSWTLEYGLVLGLGYLLCRTSNVELYLSKKFVFKGVLFVAAILVLGIVVGKLALVFDVESLSESLRHALVISPFVLLLFVLLSKPFYFSLIVSSLSIAYTLSASFQSRENYFARSFFAMHRVFKVSDTVRYMHGSTLHGVQSEKEEFECEPQAYFHPTGGLGSLFTRLEQDSSNKTVAVVGLGAGTLGAYARSGEHWDLYEIDPMVKEIAENQKYFTYLSNCLASKATYDIIIGDGRLQIANKKDNNYDLVILDAFSSDSIPAHLLTNEAFETYNRVLKEDGVLVSHISNRHLDVSQLLANLGATARYRVFNKRSQHTWGHNDKKLVASNWIVMTRRADVIEWAKSEGWKELSFDSSFRTWTDDYSSILTVMK